jgi:hypothetical protein
MLNVVFAINISLKMTWRMLTHLMFLGVKPLGIVSNQLQDYHDPSLGLMIKARACKGEGQEGSTWATSHAPESVGECEGMNLHTPKWALTLGVGVMMDSQIFREQLQGTKPIGLRSSSYHWKALGTYMSQMGLHDPLDTLNTSYGQKEGWESNCQFDSWPLKVGNCPDFLAFRWHAT